MNNTIKTLVLATATLMSAPSFAAEQVTINGQTSTYCSWTSSAAAMRKAAKAGPVTVKGWSKFEKGSSQDVECKRLSAERKAARLAKSAKKSN